MMFDVASGARNCLVRRFSDGVSLSSPPVHATMILPGTFLDLSLLPQQPELLSIKNDVTRGRDIKLNRELLQLLTPLDEASADRTRLASS